MITKIKKDQYDYLFRVVIVGNSGVGKTNLLFRYTKNEYMANLPSTIGIDFSFRNLIIDSKVVRACIWDTAGQDKFRSISTAYYHGSSAALLVYDITNYDSFKNVSSWLVELRKYAEENIVVTLVGNKSDLVHLRQVDTLEAKEFAENNQLSFIETSALDANNVDIAFKNAITEAYNIRVKNITGSASRIELENSIDKTTLKTVTINDQNAKLNSSCCN